MTDKKSDDTPTAKKKGGLKRLLVAGCALLAVGGGSAAAAVWYTGALHGSGAVAEEEDLPQLVAREDADEDAVEAARGPARTGRPDPRLFQLSYIPIEDSFTSNLAGGTAFVQLGLSLSTFYDESVTQAVEHHKLAIRSAVLVTLSEQDAQALATTAGKDALRATLTRRINQVLREREGFGGIADVQFTAFVMQ